MESFRFWATDVWGGVVSFGLWFTPEHCDAVYRALAVPIGGITLFCITIPKAVVTLRDFIEGKL